MDTPSETLGERIRREALRLGFDRVGITPVRESEHAEFYRRWLAAGRHGTMHYLARPDAVARRTDPRAAWPELRSAIVVAMDYPRGDGSEGRAVPGESSDPGDAGSGDGREPRGPERAANAPRESRPAPPPAVRRAGVPPHIPMSRPFSVVTIIARLQPAPQSTRSGVA